MYSSRLLLLSFLLASNCLVHSSLRSEEAAISIDFDRDIQPILAGRCLKCHGNGEAEAGLRLTDLEQAKQRLESGETAVIPGRPETSELLRRIVATDETRMPPAGPPLTEMQIAKLKAWISAGANWPNHWAYAPLKRPQLPTTAKSWPTSPVDQFMLDEMSRRQLSPSTAADRRVLLRRVYFDLLGLPPSVEDTEAFVADDSPDAYDRVVDRLLASPAHGERWARHWMDIVHYAETHGHDQDRPRENSWPYRDYLIQSFNADNPYGRFVAEQVAGDVLFPDDPQAIVATGMLATGPWDESSLRDIREDTLDREAARYLDRDDIVTTVMSTFASSTVHCARCHDHKFDPISQREYYGLQAIFAATDKAERPFDPDPRVARRRNELTRALAAIPAQLAQQDERLLAPEIAAQVAKWEAELLPANVTWQGAEVLEIQASEGSKLTLQPDGSYLASGPRPEKETYTIIGRTTQNRLTGLRVEVLTDDSLFHTGPGRQDNGNLHLNEVRVWSLPDAKSNAGQLLRVAAAAADFNQDGWSIEKAIDGNSATAWGIYPQVGKPHQAMFALAEPVSGDKPVIFKLELQQVHGGGHLIGRVRISTSAADNPLSSSGADIEPSIVAIWKIPASERSAAQRREIAAAFLKRKFTVELATLPPQQKVYCGTNQFQADGSFKPSTTPRVVRLLKRGNAAEPLEEVSPVALSLLPQLSGKLDLEDATNEGQRRAALAQWLVAPNNALTWRSIANRVWQFHFGRGLVDSPNDFGRMGSPPTHPQLLDWLAVELRDHAGSLKHLHRMLVTSAVYRQSSTHEPKSAAIDGDNRYFWRMNRRRLDAESLHDAILQISGTLDAKMGGPSVRQFNQTPGVHVTPNVDYTNFDVESPANYRRSIYRFVFRTIPDPFMEALDCPDSSQLTPERNASLTVLQALAMLNDKFVVRQSEFIADRAVPAIDQQASEQTTTEARVAQAYRMILSRAPSDEERRQVAAYVTRHGLANACRFLLNSNEFMFVD